VTCHLYISPTIVGGNRGVARNLLRRGGGKPGNPEDGSPQRGPEAEYGDPNTNGAVTKINLRWPGVHALMSPPLWLRLWAESITYSGCTSVRPTAVRSSVWSGVRQL